MTNEPYTEETAGQIDPQNPFENALENAAYRTDYRRFLPQILLPDFHIDRGIQRAPVRSSQKATALAAATFRESTPWDMGIITV